MSSFPITVVVVVVVVVREDTDALATFRSQWKEELGIGSRAGEDDQRGDGNTAKQDEGGEVEREDSNYSTPPLESPRPPDKMSPPDSQQLENADNSAHREV